MAFNSFPVASKEVSIEEAMAELELSILSQLLHGLPGRREVRKVLELSILSQLLHEWIRRIRLVDTVSFQFFPSCF